MLKLTIDNREIKVENGETILQAARENGIAIPTLCYHAALEPYAACRLCIVELASARGKLVAACAQPCEDAMNVLTNSERVQAARRVTAELLMASGAHLPTVQAIALAAGVERVRYSLPPSATTQENGMSTPSKSQEFSVISRSVYTTQLLCRCTNDCILCGLCVRACDELVGAHAISLVKRGLQKKFAPPFEITSAACIGCATCVLICPTGAIKLSDITPALPSRHDARTCRLCGEASLSNQFADVDALFKEVA